MPEEFINTAYVKHYVEKAQSTDSEAERNNCLYRVGTHLEVIPCNGNDKLTPSQQLAVLDAAKGVLR